ncbi:hypothetical protein BDM02DRAFT_3114457, partial [Thelephora ganbajun]
MCRHVNIHLLNLLDGSPYCEPPHNAIKWSIPPPADVVTIRDLAITSSRVMLHVCRWEPVPPVGQG